MLNNGQMTVDASQYDLPAIEREAPTTAQQQAPATPTPTDDDGEGAAQQAAEAAAAKATPDAPASTTPQFNEVEYLKDFDVETKEQLKERLEEAKQLKALKAEIDADDPYVRSLRSAIKNGISKDKHDLVYNWDDKQSDVDKVITHFMVKSGLDKDDAKFQFEKQFGLDRLEGLTEKEINADSDLREARINFKMAVNEATDFLKKHKEDALTPPAQRYREAWKDTDINSALSAAKLSIPFGETSITFDASAKPELVKELKQAVEEVMALPEFALMPDKEGQKWMQSVVRSKLFDVAGEDILNHFVNDAVKQHDAKRLEKKVNPGPAQVAAPNKAVVDEDMAIFNSYGRTQ